jgi:broad specificity phosphatase PhoE
MRAAISDALEESTQEPPGLSANRVESAAASHPKTGSITLARHGRPSLTRYLDLDWEGYEEWWKAYDESGLAPGQTPSKALIQAAADAELILASPLRRALETAHAIAPGRVVETEALFVEAPLPPPRYPRFVKMNPSSWGWGWHARVFWWMGFSRGQETRDEAKLRAAHAVDKVIALAESGRDILICGHGWFNRMMRPELTRRGWRCTRDGGDGYWSFRRYELKLR